MSIQTRKYDLKVAITCNIQPENQSQEVTDIFAELDSPDTIEAIKRALLNYCREVIVIEADEDAYDKIKNEKPDFVFNIAEGIKGESREAQIPAMLEMLGIPYSGSGVTTMSVTLDKCRTKEILNSNGIRTPRFQLLKKADEKLNIGFESALFLKPNCEGSSKGITAKSIVKNEDELRNVAAEIIDRYHQPVLIEQFLSGREFTVAMIGNPPTVLPLVEICFDSLPEGVPKFDCYDVKWLYDSVINNYDTTICPAQISDELKRQIERIAQRTFEVLDIRDFCRIDIRLDDEGNPSVLDVNALAGLIPDPRENSRFPKAAYTAGYTYEEIIGEIFIAALERTGRKL